MHRDPGESGIPTDENIERVPCAICGEMNEDPIFQASDKIFYHHKLSYPAVRCKQCGLVYLSPRPTSDVSSFFYSDEYPFKADKSAQSLEHYRPVVEFLTARDPGSLLDVGTGNSPFLPLMKEKGWDVQGTEVDIGLVDYFRENEHIDLHLGELEDAQYESESFDAVTIMGVLEHVSDPRKVLAEARRILKPRGILCLWCFNRGFEADLLGRYWLGFDSPRHLYSFSYQSLDHMLQLTGFEVACRYFRPISYSLYTGTWSLKRARNWFRSDKRATYASSLPPSLEVAGRAMGKFMSMKGSSSNVYIFARNVTPVSNCSDFSENNK